MVRLNIANFFVVCFLSLQGCRQRPGDADTLVIFSASSLVDVLKSLKPEFEKLYPGYHLALNFAGSQVLRLQIEEGASADFFFSASKRHVTILEKKDLVEEPFLLAYNSLCLVVPWKNPAGIKSIYDLVKPVRLVIANPEVPAGRYTRELFAATSKNQNNNFENMVLNNIVSQENNVRLVRAKVELNEADAAIVYCSDATTSNKIKRIPLPEAIDTMVSYFGARTTSGKKSLQAHAWLNFMKTRNADRIFKRFGFTPIVKQ